MRTKREKQILKLDEELRELEGDYRARLEIACNVVESQFARHALAKGMKVARSGWPDFLVLREGRFVGVEVKSPSDRLRPGQRKMFAMLELAGIPVYVWDPRYPDTLTPWRSLDKRRWDREATTRYQKGREAIRRSNTRILEALAAARLSRENDT